MTTSPFASRILALCSVAHRRSFPTQAKRMFRSMTSFPAALLAVFMLAAVSAHATTYTVTNTNSSGSGSLAAAIGSAASGDTIDFASGVTGTITLTSTLTLSHNVTITGPGASALTISGNSAVLVFAINSGVTASISGLTIANGSNTLNCGQSGGGGGIFNQGTLTVSNSTFYKNTVTNTCGQGIGGGIYNYKGTLTVSNSTFSNNTANGTNGNQSFGGGIGSNGGVVMISDSTFSSNSSASNSYDVGGGILNGGGSTMTLNNSTITGSWAYNGGAGIIDYGTTLNVNNSTITGNTSYDGNGGGIYNAGSGTVTLTNSIVAGNTDPGYDGEDCYNCGTQSSNNLISTSTTPITTTALKLGTLANNGGPTETMMPLTGSPALNAGSGSTLSTDQRGFPRPTGNGVVSDLGSVQAGDLTVTTTADTTNSGTTCDGTATCSLRDAITLANSYGSGDISFASSITSTPSTITLGSALPPITATNINITGPGANLLTISGNKQYEVFNINSGVTASISGLTIANGNASSGGGINNAGTLTVSNSAFSGNSAASAYGGGISNGGTVTVSNSTFSGNTAGIGGGGISNGSSGIVTVSNSTFSGNTAGGGGILNGGGTVTVSNSTFSGNMAGTGGGIYNYNGTVTLTNSIVAGNTESTSGQTGNDCYACGPQSASNLISTSSSSPSPNLGPLAYNGANQTLQTLLPLPGSPAIEAGNPALLPTGMTTDERGLPRTVNSKLDLGAVETDYTAVQFVQQPTNTLANATITPAVTLSVMESGAAALNIPVPLTLTGNGTLAGTLTETTLVTKPGTAAVATYGNLSVNTAGTGDTLDVTLPITATGITPALTLKASSGSFDITVKTTTITWTTTPPTNVTYGAKPITLAATASNGATVLYQVISGPATITGGNTLTFTGAGAVTIEAYTNASGSYGSGSLTANITVAQAAQTITFPAIAAKVFGNAPFAVSATATSSLPVTIAVTSGPATISGNTVTLTGAGTVTLTATQAGNANYSAATPVTQRFTVSAAVSTTTLTASASAIIAGQPVTFTATVQSGATLVPSGTVNFYNGTTLLGAKTVTNGVATFTTSTLAAGGNPAFTASYVGTVDYAASTSATVMVTVATPIPPSFTMAATPNTLTIPTGGIDASTLTITPTGGYTGKLTLSCSGLPANTYCYFPGNSGAQTIAVTLNGSNTAQSIALNIETGAMTAPPMARMQAMPSPFGPQPSPLSPILPALAFWWPGSMAGLAAFGRKRNLSKTQQRMLQLCLLVLMTGALAAGISGCAGLTSSAAAVRVTPAGTTKVTVTATPASGTAQTTTITVTIT